MKTPHEIARETELRKKILDSLYESETNETEGANWGPCIERIMAAIAAATEDLRADKERLDWLDEESNRRGVTLAVMERRSGKDPIYWAGIEWNTVTSDKDDNNSLRQAIDTARAERKGGRT